MGDARPPLIVVPITREEVQAFVREHHRHNAPTVQAIFRVGCSTDGRICGVAEVGRPVARMLCDEWTAEVRRVCTDGTPNACSLLYGAAWRAARALGYRRLITYTLATEPGVSLRAAGWRVVAEVAARSWHTPSRPRVDSHPLQERLGWEVSA